VLFLACRYDEGVELEDLDNPHAGEYLCGSDCVILTCGVYLSCIRAVRVLMAN
jgi:hypothetical protein